MAAIRSPPPWSGVEGLGKGGQKQPRPLKYAGRGPATTDTRGVSLGTQVPTRACTSPRHLPSILRAIF